MTAILLGLVIGAVLGLVGAGGSIIAVPALIYGVGMNPAQAIPASLIIVGLGALTALLPRIRQGIDWATAAAVGAAGIPASWLGTAVNRMADPNVLMLIFAALMVTAAVLMLTAQRRGTALPSVRRGFRSHASRALGVGALVGFLTGLLGVGGGFIIVPALTLLLGLEMSTSVGTSLVIIVINSVAGFSAHIQNLTLNWPIVLTFAASAIVGSLIAARLATRLPDMQIRVAFAITVLLVAAFVAVKSGYALATS
ncbi:MAG: sulfite exporter TauE/SafE family protein [Actinomycetota bacterium]